MDRASNEHWEIYDGVLVAAATKEACADEDETSLRAPLDDIRVLGSKARDLLASKKKKGSDSVSEPSTPTSSCGTPNSASTPFSQVPESPTQAHYRISQELTESCSQLNPRDGKEHIMTISSQQVLKRIKSYGELIKPMQSQAVMIYSGLTDLFDAYLLNAFMTFAGISLEDLVWSERRLTNRLRSTVLRIMQANERYRGQIEEIQRNPPAASPLKEVAQMFGMNSNKLKMDFKMDLNQPFKSYFTGQKDGMNVNGFSSTTPRGSSGPASPDTHALAVVTAKHAAETTINPAMSAARHMFGIKERVVAVDSLQHLADELHNARPTLITTLPARLGKEVDAYFSRTVDCVADLKDCIYRSGVRTLLHGLFDTEKGIEVQISATNYSSKEPATQQAPWTQDMAKHYSMFAGLLTSAQLQQEVELQMWDQAIIIARNLILEGFARVRRCTIEGRAAMSLDLSVVEKTLKKIAPQGQTVNMRSVDTYIKAFYIPWDELAHWSQTHLPEYGKAKIVGLIENVAEAFRVRAQLKRDLLAQIDAEYVA